MKYLLLVVLLGCSLARAGIESREFSDPGEQARYLKFTAELRCPKCQNQNLADSNAPIAADLRDQLYRLLREGRTDEEIVDFMVQRYGDYVLYKPRIEPRTWLLWGGPFAMLLAGIGVALVMMRSGRDRVRSLPGLDDDERRRLAQILGEETQR